jgi:hypothetical protein
MSVEMSRAARSVWLFSFYLIALGGVLMVAPGWFLQLFRLPSTDEVWIRVVGLLVVVLSYYYWRAARAELTLFIRATMHARWIVFVGLSALAVAGLGPAILIAFGAVDSLAATWTWLGLRADSA